MEGEKKRQEDPPLPLRAGTTGVLQRPQRQQSLLFCGRAAVGVFSKNPLLGKLHASFCVCILPCGGCGLWEHKATAGVLLGPPRAPPTAGQGSWQFVGNGEFLQFPPEN